MSRKHQITVVLVSFFLMGIYTVWIELSKSSNEEHIPKENAVYLQQKAMIDGLCSVDSKENINRWHLQQSWFYDAEFQEIAGVFGNVAFSLYINGSNGEEKIEAAYCIEEKVLKVQFYETQQKLKSFNFNADGFSMQYRSRLKVKEQESIRVVSLDEKQMILYFENQKREQRFFRKN